MFSRSIDNDYGTYVVKDSNTTLLRGVYDKNFRELKTIDPTTEQYKVFDATTINFAIKIGTSTYIPSHIFKDLFQAYTEGNPYYTINDINIIPLDISNTLDYIATKYASKQLMNGVLYSGSADTSGSVTVNQATTQKYQTRFEQAGVLGVEFQFYTNNNPYTLNDDNIIKQILFLFEESPNRVQGISHLTIYEDKNGAPIMQNLPINTAVVPPVTQKVNFLDDYLRDVKR